MASTIHIEDLPCVCISLARRSDRWDRFINQPEVKALPNLRRFDAVDGKKIDLTTDNRISAFTKKNILTHSRRSHHELDSIGGVGCALSHIGVWREFLDSGSPYMLVFEDDAIVYPGLVKSVNEALPKDFDLIVLTRAYKSLSLVPVDGFEPVSNFVLAHCYIISRKAAQIFYDEALPITGHIDLYMSTQCALHKLKLYCSKKLAAPQFQQGSDIVTKSKCYICDVPTDYEKSMALISQWDLKLARSSEILLGVVVFAWISHQMFSWMRSRE
jgi:glycosyl transferase family 25